MTDDRTETIHDRAAIRATDDPDPFRRNPVAQTGPDDPWRFTRFVADDHECVIVRDEYDEPAPFGSCATHRRALSSPVALGCATPAPVGAAVALDLDAIHETICDNFTGMAEVQQAADLLVAEVRRLVKYRDWWKASSLANAEDVRRLTAICHDWRDRSETAEAEVRRLTESRSTVAANLAASLLRAEAEVRTLRAKVAEVEALADQWADRKRSDGMSGNAWIGLTLSGVAADLRAALATTGEGL